MQQGCVGRESLGFRVYLLLDKPLRFNAISKMEPADLRLSMRFDKFCQILCSDRACTMPGAED